MVENRKLGRVILLYASQWDDADFGADILPPTPRRSNEVEEDGDGAGDRRYLKGRGDDGAFVLSFRDTSVTSVEGF